MCGVVGIYGHREAANLAYLGLHALQHRGQESAGIVSSDGERLRWVREMGHVGEIFTAEQALKHGLVDKIGFREEAIARALELAKLNKDSVRVVKYERPPSLFDGIGYANARQPSGAFDLVQLLDFSAPRAWYLATSLPAIATTRRAD